MKRENTGCGGVNESNHNTILIEIDVTKIQTQKMERRTTWNIKAPAESFAAFRRKLEASTNLAHTTMSCNQEAISERYTTWEKLLYKAAIITIGKTTYKPGRPPKTTQLMNRLREERKRKK